MRPKQMQELSGPPAHHECAPKDWRTVPDVSGDYDLDATIMHRDNPNLPDRLNLYVKRGRGPAYGPLTGYNGYHGYGGDN
jgi:hypothetical protein